MSDQQQIQDKTTNALMEGYLYRWTLHEDKVTFNHHKSFTLLQSTDTVESKSPIISLHNYHY